MAKKITFAFFTLLAAFSVVISSVIPHHHHHGDETHICFADDITENDHCCGGEHHAPDGSCCGVKANLLTHFGDSRKEEFHCDCDSGHQFHGGHLYVLLISLNKNELSVDILPATPYEYPPYSNFYHSQLTRSHIGLRAPPVA